MTTIRERMLADHERLNDLLTRLNAAFEVNDRDEMASLWNQLDVGLTTHLEAEEQYLFPALLTAAPKEEAALRLEHEAIRKQLLDLGIRVDLHTVRLDGVRAFIDYLVAHAKKEDAILYRWADEHVEAVKRASVLSAIEFAAERNARSVRKSRLPAEARR